MIGGWENDNDWNIDYCSGRNYWIFGNCRYCIWSGRELSDRLKLFVGNASFAKKRLLHCVIAMRRVTRYTVYSVRGKE